MAQLKAGSTVGSLKIMTTTRGVLEDYQEKLIETDDEIDLYQGTVFVVDITKDTTFDIKGVASNETQSFTLIIKMGDTVYPLFFPSHVIWQGDEIPDMTEANQTYVLTFLSINSSLQWMGMFGGQFSC